MKRLVDFLVACTAIVLLSPVLLCIGIAVRLSDGGPIFFQQIRVGQNCQHFRIFKFRSMIVNATQYGGFSTAVEDPRITLIGRFIRGSSLDELPQLFNVVMGHMSLVGPRPDVPAQRSLYSSSEWKSRHLVRPGITGLAQATLRSDATPEQRKSLDLQYALKPSLALDAKIILLTVKQIFLKGSY